MRRTVRLFSEQGPQQRLAAAIATLPSSAQQALVDVARRDDLPLAAGSWNSGGSGCLVANVVALHGASDGGTADTTLDLRILDLFPELSSRALNQLIVAWDTAAEQDGAAGDAALRDLLRGALVRAGVLAAPPSAGRTATDWSAVAAAASEVSVRGADAALVTAGSPPAARDGR